MEESIFYRITVSAGSASYDLSRDIASLSWEVDDAKPDLLTMSVPDPYKVLSHALCEGMRVEFWFGTDLAHELVFRGRILAVEASFSNAGIPTLTVKAEDRAAELGLKETPGKYWEKKKLSEIVTAVLEPYKFKELGIQPGGDPTVTVHQHEQTDLAFLQQLARDFGCVMFVVPRPQDEKLCFVGLAALMAAEPAFVFTHGRFGVDNTLIAFDGHVDPRRAQSRVVFLGDTEDGEPITTEPIAPAAVGEADDPFLGENLAAIADVIKRDQLQQLIANVSVAAGEMTMLRATDTGAHDVTIYVSRTTAEELELRRTNWASVNTFGMTATGACAGVPGLRARSTILLNDVGGRFSGQWYVSRVVHSVGADGYRSEFECKR